MADVTQLLITAPALAACLHLARQAGWRLGGHGLAERAVIGCTVAVAWLTAGGYVLAIFRQLASPALWLAWLAAGAILAGRPVPWLFSRRAAARWRQRLVGRPYLGLAALLVAWIALTNLAIVFGSAPNQWDAMFYHLARVGYHLQQGDLAAYGANYPWQVEFPKNSAVLLAAGLVLTGKSDWITGLPQFAAWLALGAAVFCGARTYRVHRSASAFAGLVAMALSIAWLEATTAQNDLLIAAEAAAALFFLRRHAAIRRQRFLALAGFAIGLAVGTKASALVLLPALALAAGPALWRGRVLVITALAALPFILPSGYLENLRRFGNPLGRETVRQHLAPGVGAGERLGAAGRNALRYAFDFASLDEAPPLGDVSRALGETKRAAAGALARAGIDLERKDDVHLPFWVERVHRPDDNLSWFGPFGLLLVAGFVAAVGRRELRWLAAAAAIYGGTLCFAGPYDSVAGRLFLPAVVFVLPGLAWWAERWRRAGRIVATAFVALAAVHLAPAALLRNNFFVVAAEGRPSFWRMDRVQQMTGFHPSYPAQRAFAEKVPLRARVGVGFAGYEYPLFGPGLARTLVPVATLLREGRPLPSDLDWLVFDGAVSSPQPGDESLGANLFLRRLSAE